MKAYVYILHFDQKLAHAQHYTGWTVDVDARMAKHRAGNGGRLPAVFSSKGIGFSAGLVHECKNSTEARQYEWRLKHRWKKVHRFCSLCHSKPTPLPTIS